MRFPLLGLQATQRQTVQAINHLLAVDYSKLPNAVDDAAAATAGVEKGELYRNGSAVMVRTS